MEKGYLEVQKCFPVSFNSFSTPFLGQPVKLELTHSRSFSFVCFRVFQDHQEKMGFFSMPLVNHGIQNWTQYPPVGPAGPAFRGILQPLSQALLFYRSHQLWATTSFCWVLVGAHCHPEPVRLFHVHCCHPWDPIITFLQRRRCIHTRAPLCAHMSACLCLYVDMRTRVPLCASKSARVCLCVCARICHCVRAGAPVYQCVCQGVCIHFKPPHILLTLSASEVIRARLSYRSNLLWTFWTLILSVVTWGSHSLHAWTPFSNETAT